MREDLQKNFILLSKVAKEKKYAQEYMGLLARRGDIGSVRIGKRWYTTWEWFEEFLENSQKKKRESVCEAQVVQPVKIEEVKSIYTEKDLVFAKVPVGEEETQKIEINVPLVFPEREMVYAAPKAENILSAKSEAIKIEDMSSGNSFGIKINKLQAPKVAPLPMPKRIEFEPSARVDIKRQERRADVSVVPKIMANQYVPADVRDMRGYVRKADLPKNISIQEKNENPLLFKEIKFRKHQDVFSPVFEAVEETRASFFPKFVFATGFAIMIFLVAVSGYFVFSDGIFKKGIVAGASSERNGEFSGISSGGEYFLARAGDKMKETLSVSRVVVEAVKEKTTKSASPEDAKAVPNIN